MLLGGLEGHFLGDFWASFWEVLGEFFFCGMWVYCLKALRYIGEVSGRKQLIENHQKV